MYSLMAYLGGFFLIVQNSWLVNFIGVLLLAHAMVIAAYLIHECAHNTIFLNNASNARLGRVLMWLTGAAYSDYEDIRNKHFRHHVDRADVVSFDYRPILAAHPRLLKLIKILEWVYIPAVEIMMHALVVILPFVQDERRNQRARVVAVLAIRSMIFLLLVAWQPRVILLYPLAYMLFMTVLRFMDTHQHTFEVSETLDRKRGQAASRFDAAYEQRNTYSNLISTAYPWLNLLTLNFGYHNAHHARPTTPWYRLPGLHRELYGQDDRQILPFPNLLRAFHRYRLARVLNADDGELDVLIDRGRGFVGVNGVSFLTAH
jgi:fatty acid desaturase